MDVTSMRGDETSPLFSDRQSYRNAANRPGVDGDTREFLYLLAETFPLARASLNRMTDRCLF